MSERFRQQFDDEPQQESTLAKRVYNPDLPALPVRRDAITRQPDGTLKYQRFVMTPTGLKVPENASLKEFQDLGQALSDMQTGIQWVLGDWVNAFIDRGFDGRNPTDKERSDAYETIGKNYNFQPNTIKQYAYVARNASIRIDALSFGHHHAVIGCTPERQVELLNNAVAGGWSIARLRKEAVGDSPTPPIKLKAVMRDFATYLTENPNMGQGERAKLRKFLVDFISQLDAMDGV